LRKLESTDAAGKRDRLQKELGIVHSQRMKGVSALRENRSKGKTG
jgi:hypothetical protein